MTAERPAARPAVLALAALLLAACAPGTPPPRHVLLIVLDATHAGQLSCYGGPPGLTPTLDALAARGRRFDRAHSAAAWTLPSTASLFTGRLPERHGVLTDEQALPDEALTLAELLADAGWSTAAFVQMVYASDSYNLEQGFSHYRYYGTDAERRDSLLVHDAGSWMEEHAGDRSFAYVHFRRPHGPYDPTPEAWRRLGPSPPFPSQARFYQLERADAEIADTSQLAPGERELIERLYRANLATIDDSVASLLARLPDAERTLVIVTADHGEALGQHGRFGHGAHVWAETIDIPLIVAGPGVPAGVDGGAAGTADILPTLLEACGVPLPAALALDGASLWPRLTGRAPATAGSAAVPVCSRYGGDAPPAVAVIEGRWKLILAPDGEAALFDRSADRGDSQRLEAREPAIAERLARLAQAWREEHRDAELAPLPAPELPADRREDLRQLGYVR
ncbi:MAG TPA: sulfatase [Planctomycetota bacterium]|nr:sulfatase [Planctomycetota bacterium]